MVEEGPQVNIHPDKLKSVLKKIAKRKTPDLDGLHGFGSKNFTFIHDRLAMEINKCIQKTEKREWITKGKITLIQKDSIKGTPPKQLLTHNVPTDDIKILMVPIREKIYYSLINRGIFLDEHKGCRKRTKSTKDLLYIDQHILNERKTRRKNLAMASIDYKKTFDMGPQSWILHSLKMYKIPDQIVQFIVNTMQTWRVELAAGGKGFAEVKIQRDIFQGDALSPLLFVIAMMPLNHILRKCTAGNKLSK